MTTTVNINSICLYGSMKSPSRFCEELIPKIGRSLRMYMREHLCCISLEGPSVRADQAALYHQIVIIPILQNSAT
ncbi:hypothetical protein C5167_026673 [Papaver somniferum]|nr:hypothetical protein C5167_026673 [Papaver somniferum]